MKSIIVPVDFSESSLNALRFAVQIAETVEAKLHLIHVIQSRKSVVSYLNDTNIKTNESLAQKALDELVTNLRSKTAVPLEAKVYVGNIFNEISNVAKYNEASLIVIGTHGLSGIEDLWIGSTAYKVINNSPCPVLSIRQTFEVRPIKRIVLPIDYTPETRQKVPFIAEFASMLGAEVHVLDICERNQIDLLPKIQHFKDQVIDFLHKHKISCISNSIRGTNLTNITIEYAESVNADVIAIMTEQNAKTKNIWLGPYAQQMVNHSPIPILSIHPF
ncbi:MAG TPA: universal stress protein [Salinivirgaceae bacterium]|nr:universal stress protein [Salinivirgaceae bacterium]